MAESLRFSPFEFVFDACFWGFGLNFTESLWLSSAVSVLLAVVFVGICSVMAITALVQGETKTPRILPQLDNGASFFNLFTAIPVIFTAFTFHFNGTHYYTHEYDHSFCFYLMINEC